MILGRPQPPQMPTGLGQYGMPVNPQMQQPMLPPALLAQLMQMQGQQQQSYAPASARSFQ